MLTSAGQIAVTAFPDRMVVTWNAEIAEWPGIATAAVPAAAPAFFATIDLPAVARTWGPLLAMAVPAEHRHLLPPLPVLIEHLPQWRLTCDATPDGARCEERGLPLFFGLAGLVSLRSAGDIPRKNGRVQDPGTTDSEPVPQAGF